MIDNKHNKIEKNTTQDSLLQTNTILAKKSLGQHFLKNEKVIQRIIDLAHIKPYEQVMEIGPGPGALTNILRDMCHIMPLDKFWLIEKDDVFAENHKIYAQKNNINNIHVLHLDALTFDWHSLEGDWKIIGNLPYNVASPLMWDIVSQVANLSRAVFMIQKEVAVRIRATQGNKTYGALSAWIQSFCKVEKGFVVTPSAFTPPPKVDSEVIVLKPLSQAELPKDPENLAKIIKVCFQQRRKQLHGILQKAFPNSYSQEIWNKLGINKEARAETLSPKQFQALTELLIPQN